MSEECDDRQGNNGALQEDDEQILQRDGDLAAHDDAADLGHINQLCDTGCGHHKAGQFALCGAGNNAGKEHISKADDNSLAGQFCFGDLEEMIQRDKGEAEKLKERGVFSNDQSDCTHSQNDGQGTKPHLTYVFQTLTEEFFHSGGLVGLFQSQLQTVLRGLHVVGNVFAVRDTGIVALRNSGERRQLGNDDGSSNTRQSDNQVEGEKHMVKTHLTDDHQTEGDTDCGECGGDDCGFPLGVKTLLILLAGEKHADGAVTQPGGHAVKGASAWKIEDGAHEADHQSTEEVQKTVVEQQGQQNARQQEHAHQNGNQIIDDQTAGSIADNHLGTDVKIDHIGKQESDHTYRKPEALDGEQIVQLGIAFEQADSNNFMYNGKQCTGTDQNPDNGKCGIPHKVQQCIGGNSHRDGKITILIDGCYKEKCADQRGNEKFVKFFLFQQIHDSPQYDVCFIG